MKNNKQTYAAQQDASRVNMEGTVSQQKLNLFEKLIKFDEEAPPELRGYYTLRGSCLAYAQMVHIEDNPEFIFKSFNIIAQNAVMSFEDDSYEALKYIFLEIVSSFKMLSLEFITNRTLNALKNETQMFRMYLQLFSEIMDLVEMKNISKKK